MKTLYVIGNGFDLHHGICCSYADFRVWLGKYHCGLLSEMDEVYGLCDSQWWLDFERNLGEFDIMNYAQSVANENPVDLSSDHCDSMWNDAQIEVENQMTQLYDKLQICFEEWVGQLNTPSSNKMIYINSTESLFLVFNYTRTLESLYGVQNDSILHIHGVVGSERLIFGHGKTMDMLREEYPTPDELYRQGKINEELASDYDIHDQLAWEEAFKRVSSIRKPVEEIIKQNADFFHKIKDVKKICVYGFSFSDIDLPYIKEIAKLAVNAHWEISYFNKSDQDRIYNFIKCNGIANHSLVRLSEIHDPAQLEIDYK